MKERLFARRAYRTLIHGTQGHAGTVPMAGRKDAVAAAAEMINYIERRCRPPSETAKGGAAAAAAEDTMLVCTVGDVRVWPGASNVISSNTNFSVDIRSKSDGERDATVKDVVTAIERTCAGRGMRCLVDRNHDAAAVLCDDTITAGLARAAAEVRDEASESAGGAAGAAPPVLISGAGHDALAMVEACPIGMLFVRCRDGVSHSPLEHTDAEDVAFAGRVLWKYLKMYQSQGGRGRRDGEL